jgi:hypothetical protein
MIPLTAAFLSLQSMYHVADTAKRVGNNIKHPSVATETASMTLVYLPKGTSFFSSPGE